MLTRDKSANFLIRCLKTVPYLMVFTAPIFLGIGIWMGMSLTQFVDNSIEAQAIVIRVDEKRGQEGLLYRHVFEVTDQGQQMQYAGNTWRSPPLHDLGEVVDGRFDRANGKIMSDAGIDRARSSSSSMKEGALINLVLGLGYFAWRRFSPKRA